MAFGLLSWGVEVDAQTGKKEVGALRIDSTIEIDGRLIEENWLKAEVATGFIQEDPYPGKKAGLESVIRVLYDDDAIYIGARLHDSEPDRILRELTERNDIGNADHFEVLIDPYRDGINGYSFAVTSSGVQRDARMFGTTKDAAWDAVWESAVTIDSAGWVVEMRIPYSAIRFPKLSIQNWSINFGRNIRRTREQNWWSEIDPNEDGILAQSGTLTELIDLKPPLRLSLYPFLAVSKDYNDFSSDNPWGLSGGMDLKYGISQAFTLDVSLIPDFSQTRFDEDVLNLTPFEVVFDENRQFFTEGMEIFNRGDLFYSRRVAGTPSFVFPLEGELNEGEEVAELPLEGKLLNATKLSGRTNNGLGLGFFNGITSRENVSIRTEDGSIRKAKRIPLTNYNVVVADQSLKNNSHIAIMNTNVWREGSAPFSNSTGTDFQFFTNERKYAVRGYGHYTVNEEFQGENRTGHQYHLDLAKVSGKIRGGVRYREISDGFDPNDLGLLLVNNERRLYANVGYYQFEPIGPVNRFNTTLQFRYAQLYSSSDRTGLRLNWDASAFLKTWDAFFFNVSHHPEDVKDFFEPRTTDFSRFYKYPANTYGRFLYSSDFRRTLAVNFEVEATFFPDKDRKIYGWSIGPRIRFTDQFFTTFSVGKVKFENDKGFVLPDPEAMDFEVINADEIYFGSRNRETFENTLNLRYIFSNKMNAVLRVRHFYSQVNYSEFFRLRNDGELEDISYSGKVAENDDRTLHDLTFHLFNVDMVYTWRFAPGSDLIFVWKNNILSSRNEDPENYFRELGSLFERQQENSFVIKAVYYLDYYSIFGKGER